MIDKQKIIKEVLEIWFGEDKKITILNTFSMELDADDVKPKDILNDIEGCISLAIDKTEKATAKEIFNEIEKSFKGEIWRNSYLSPQNKLQNLKKKFGVDE